VYRFVFGGEFGVAGLQLMIKLFLGPKLAVMLLHVFFQAAAGFFTGHQTQLSFLQCCFRLLVLFLEIFDLVFVLVDFTTGVSQLRIPFGKLLLVLGASSNCSGDLKAKFADLLLLSLVLLKELVQSSAEISGTEEPSPSFGAPEDFGF
jgi:hypothetical protein